jgi:hypothetical protein
MTEQRTKHQDDLLLSNLHYSGDSLEFAIAMLPKVQEIILAITNFKLDRTPDNQAKYNSVMADFANMINDNYTATFFLSHIFRDLGHLLTIVRSINIDNRINKNSRQNTLQFIQETCSRHYSGLTEKNISG